MSDLLNCASPTEWESWLTAHWQRPTGVWLQIAKKGSRVASVTANEALGRSERYAVILPLLKARTPQQRAERLRVTMASLAASGQAP